MASASGPATGYGPQVHGTSIYIFNGSQVFSKFQQDLQKNCPFHHFNLMGDNASDQFEAMCLAIEELKHKEKTEGKGSAEITFREHQKKDVIKDDSELMRILNAAVKEPARTIAFPYESEFVLESKPFLPGAKAYQLLVKEYGLKKANMLDKFNEKQAILDYFVAPKLDSPQLHVFLTSKVDEHIAKFDYKDDVANDLYIEVTTTFVQNLPNNPTFMEVKVTTREELEEGSKNAKQYFTALAERVQKKFKALQEIQHIESASKATAFTKQRQLVKKFEKTAEANCRNFEKGYQCAQTPCPYKHPKPIKGKDNKDKTSKISGVKGKVAVVGETVDLIDQTNIKNSLYYCSYSLQIIASQNTCLDTGATATMSSDKKSFTNLMPYKTPIRVANNQIIQSSHKGIFHLHVALTNGKEIQLLFPESLYVPNLSGTLVSDQSLLKLHFTITLDQNGLFMKRNNERVDLIRTSNGVITFPKITHAKTMCSRSRCGCHLEYSI